MSKMRLIVKKAYDHLRYTLDEEVLNVLLSPEQHKLICAPAGGTKTSLTQMAVALLKLEKLVTGLRHNRKVNSPYDRIASSISRDRILCIVFNRHNAEDIKTVHGKMFDSIYAQSYFSYDPSDEHYSDPSVTASTLHAYSLSIIKDNLDVLKLRSFDLTAETKTRPQFESIIKSVMAESSVPITNSLINNIRQLYDLYVGLKLYETPEDRPLTDTVQFELVLQGMDVPAKYLREIFTKYDKRKKLLRLFEFSDQLRLADQILNIPEKREYYSNYFEVIVADEVQDFTPLMFSIYKSLVGPNTKTITVGDPDQSIYSFLGAHEDAIGQFNNIMGIEAKRFDLAVNRRCRVNTMPFARNVIALNPTRVNREIITNKPDGILNRVDFSKPEEQIQTTYSILMSKPVRTTGILFRNKQQSVLLSRYLFIRKIAVNYINAHAFNDHRLYTMFIDLLYEVFINKTMRGLTMLYRILPFKYDSLKEFLQIDEKGISAKCPNPQFWANIDFTPLYGQNSYFSINGQVEFVKEVARDSNSVIAADVIPRLADMFYHNYAAYLTDIKEDPFAPTILTWVKSDLALGYGLARSIEQFSQTTNNLISQSRSMHAYNISTIHGTKGLEFNRVILNLEGDDVPHQRNISPNALMFQEEEENRLYYVASTRQIDELHVLCNVAKPHRLGDPKFFEGAKQAELKPVFSNSMPDTLAKKDIDEEIVATPRGRSRRISILED